jgi:hypothetical protein
VGRGNLLAVEVTSLTDYAIGLALEGTRIELPRSAATERPAIGQRCWLAVRPEHIVLATCGAGTVPLLTAVVERVAHQNIGVRSSTGARWGSGCY